MKSLQLALEGETASKERRHVMRDDGRVGEG
jgi:hypothetical protein